MVKIKRALLSVSDKTGLVEFARALAEIGVELISTGGTARTIKEAGVPVIEISNFTGFPEIMDGRVKTLHPKVHGGILMRRRVPEHVDQAKQHGIEPIDLVVVNLYPFEQTISQPFCHIADAIENIDIGGPAMVRSAAKNYESVAVLVNSGDYQMVLAEIKDSGGCVSLETRSKLAFEAFSMTAAYDSAISGYLAKHQGVKFPNILTLSFRKAGDFRYGENPHQDAARYISSDSSEPCASQAKLLPGGKEFSFNNCGDADGALELVKEFSDPAVVIIKHTNASGCAVDTNLVQAYVHAYLAEVNAAMGGIIATNRPVTEELAQAIVESYQRWGKDCGAGGFFAEVIIAPSFLGSSIDIIRNRKGWGNEVRLLTTGELTGGRNSERALRYVVGGLLVQDRDLLGLNEDKWKVVTKRQPTADEMRDVRFAWLGCKHVKSNAIVLAKDLIQLGIGAGQMSRVNSAMLANMFAKHYGGADDRNNRGCIFASDAFLPFPDSLDWAVSAGATVVIQPGGSKKDEEVTARADELGLTMVFTGTRHFKH